jgi:hypothetical protein
VAGLLVELGLEVNRKLLALQVMGWLRRLSHEPFLGYYMAKLERDLNLPLMGGRSSW